MSFRQPPHADSPYLLDQQQPLKIVSLSGSAVQGVLALEDACFARPWSRQSWLLELEQSTVLGISDGEHPSNDIRAVAAARIGGDQAELMRMMVAPAFRRRGYGRLLLHELGGELCRRGVEQLFLEVRPSNGAARKLYDQMGFASIGIRRGYYGPPAEEDALCLALRLRGR